MIQLQVVWQRLLSPERKTCDRCSAPQEEMHRAMDKLRQSLRPLGIEPVLEVKEIDDAQFRADPSESNRIWLAGRPSEEWLGAKVGSSPCCSVCTGAECRTVEVAGNTFEVISEQLFLKSALMAASQLLGAGADGRPS